jgi:hypothetical protein
MIYYGLIYGFIAGIFLNGILKEMNNIDFTKVRYWRKNGNRN